MGAALIFKTLLKVLKIKAAPIGVQIFKITYINFQIVHNRSKHSPSYYTKVDLVLIKLTISWGGYEAERPF